MCLPTGRVHHFSKRGSALRFEQAEQRCALCSGSRGGCRHYRFQSFENSICFAGAGHDGSLHSEAPAQCRCSHHPKPQRYSEAVARRRGCVMTVLAMLELRAGSSRFCSIDSVKFEDDFQLARSALQRRRTSIPNTLLRPDSPRLHPLSSRCRRKTDQGYRRVLPVARITRLLTAFRLKV